MYEIINNIVKQSSMRYNIKLEVTYILPNTDNKQNRAFKTQSDPYLNQTNKTNC